MQQEQQAFQYQNDDDYVMHAAAMTQQGWYLIHQQRNFDNTISVTWQRVLPLPVYQSAPVAQSVGSVETMVREYRSADEFSRDARKLAGKGWTLVSQSAGITRTAVAKNIRNTVLTLGINRITPGIGGVARKTTVVATYQRQRQ